MGRGVTACRRGFTTRVSVTRGGLSACNGTAGKRRLRLRWSCKGRWTEILHGEMVGGGSLSQRIGGGLEAGSGCDMEKEVLYPSKRHRFDAKKKIWIKSNSSEWTGQFVRFTSQTVNSACLIHVQSISGLIDQTKPKPWLANNRTGQFNLDFKTMAPLNVWL